MKELIITLLVAISTCLWFTEPYLSKGAWIVVAWINGSADALWLAYCFVMTICEWDDR